MAGCEGVHGEGVRGVAVKTKNIMISALIISYTAILNFFDTVNVPVSFLVLIFFYPILNEYFIGYFIITIPKTIWTGSMIYTQYIIAAKPYLLIDSDFAFLTVWSDAQLMVFSGLYLSVLWLLAGAGLMRGLNKIGYYKRIESYGGRLL